MARMRELRDRREQVAETIRKTSPRFASLIYPQPLDLAGAQRSLDEGTVPLVPTAPPVSVFTLPIGEAALREKVTALRNLIQRGAGANAPADALATAGQELFATLIEPARALIGASDRVLISPDGPLHTLPFAVLRQPAAGGVARYFVEWKPLHVVASATVYAELKRTRRVPDAAPPALTLAAFGDPAYPPPATELADRLTNPDVRAAVRRGYALEPLPASRREVDEIVRLYPGRAAAYLGEQATEERAKAIGRGVRYLHFAGHGLLDERFPLNSALALTIPERPGEGQANGLLQAWEIFEQMRIDADLVTLSACETGLGKEQGGEGLMGLTRAFQYAGARTVLASLWSVGDDSTADLMTRFYGHLKAGRTKDEALRAAQLEMIRARGTSHPFQWAAFQLAGDWR
jgi:CHAT domain-containing protein